MSSSHLTTSGLVDGLRHVWRRSFSLHLYTVGQGSFLIPLCSAIILVNSTCLKGSLLTDTPGRKSLRQS
ncbi:hypothetical protein BJY04DRAFT_131277 [Aspergillus karnatakaensis]|uniref:uncharacterized protein n=1 Tax=Aspergillus karnatakaensis TaxID=1810916 RepID=UPI003CCCE1D7